MQQQQARPPTNDNYPDAALGLRGNAPFPEADITFCHQYSTHVYDDNGREHLAEHVVVPFVASLSSEDEAFHSDSDADDSSSSSREPADYAYWLIRHIRDCQFGYVWHGRLLRRLPTSDGSLKWGIELTEVAVKEMQFHEIRNHRGRDDPETEVRAMQFLQQHIAPDEDMEGLPGDQVIQHKLQAMMDRGVVTSIDSLQNETSIFVVMPFCDGGDFLDFLLARNVNLTEPQLRLWFNQFLTGIETLQSAGMCHRDISFENVVMKNTTDGVGSCALVIDLGMCLRIPYIEVNGEQRRCLLQRQRRVGKPKYVSPEIFHQRPFDGHTVDMWAIGIMLMIMTIGSLPWDVPVSSNEHFHNFSSGHTADCLRAWGFERSDELYDLLQGMLWADPRNRLSLQQVRAHPWMNEPIA